MSSGQTEGHTHIHTGRGTWLVKMVMIQPLSFKVEQKCGETCSDAMLRTLNDCRQQQIRVQHRHRTCMLQNQNGKDIYTEIIYEKQHALRVDEWMIMSEETGVMMQKQLCRFL